MVCGCCILSLCISEEMLFVVKALEITLNKHFIFQIIVDNLCSVMGNGP